MTFEEHTFERRSRLSSFWSVEDVVYGAFGPALSPNATRHAVDGHFHQLDAAYPSALQQVIDELTHHIGDFIVRPPMNFEELYCRVDNLIGGINGIGPLALYDISLRIGCNLFPKVIPKKFVYIHKSGIVADAAKELLPGITASDINKLDVALFANIFPHMSAMDIEDALCIYSKMIVKEGKFERDWLIDCPK